MRVKITLLVVVLAAAGIAYYWYQAQLPQIQVIRTQNTFMKITSAFFSDGSSIPSKFTCDGADINPGLSISDVPGSAKSLALIMDDPDAPRGTFIHWVMWNIPADTKIILENFVPAEAQQGHNSSDKIGYIGPCPSSGTHRYFFKLYALDTILNLPAATGSQELQDAMNGRVLEEAQLMGMYRRM